MSDIWQIKTQNLLLREATKADVNELVRINATWEAYENVAGEKPMGQDEYLKAVKEGILPPQGAKENFHQLIIFKEELPVAIASCYEGYPAKSTFYIGELVVDKVYRKEKIGKEVVALLLKQAKMLGFESSRIAVHLKNVSGLSFWFAMGFNKITKVVPNENFPILELEKD